MTADQFQCDECGEVFDKGWSDEEAQEEAKRNWGGGNLPAEEQAVICDDCYDRLMKRIRHLRN